MTDDYSRFARGVCFVPRDERFLSCGDDKTVKLWSASQQSAVQVYHGQSPFT